MSSSSSQEVQKEIVVRKKALLVAVTDGSIIPIEEVPDLVFSEKMIGEGFAMIPTSDVVYAPIGGKLFQVADALHAFEIRTEDGLEVLVHVGLDTVTLNGAGFKTNLKKGMVVKQGEPLVEFDKEYLISRGCRLFIPVVVINGGNENYRYVFKPNNEVEAQAKKTIALTIEGY
ncbi:PTS system IIA component, Glc family [Carnobacterium alterfunditum]|jgi:glucose-specific phosphotransferase system IIA component|uniref:PTS system IIA component, Glc family n=1 Tax=Carnobacterium alterfunditum TaxID=28230 RepID=A0A1N6F9L3_9LACT|nr:PTS glucose transporter subunit IIA [Carnobacterium alterfunditum]SIN91961.1 PTS system IIA component, Glc family [Carnobacterium alterfunditum]